MENNEFSQSVARDQVIILSKDLRIKIEDGPQLINIDEHQETNKDEEKQVIQN